MGRASSAIAPHAVGDARNSARVSAWMRTAAKLVIGAEVHAIILPLDVESIAWWVWDVTKGCVLAWII